MITVKYLGPTNTKGARWKASRAGLTATITQDCQLSAEDNAKLAAVAWVEKHIKHGHDKRNIWLPLIYCGGNDTHDYFMPATDARKKASEALGRAHIERMDETHAHWNKQAQKKGE